MNTILEQKRRLVQELSALVKKVDITKSLQILETYNVFPKSESRHATDVILFARLIHCDLVIGIQEHLRPMDKLLYEQYQKKAYDTQLQAIESFLETHRIEYVESYFNEWSEWFRLDPMIGLLYSAILNKAFNEGPQDIIHFLQNLLEKDKTNVLSNFETSKPMMKFRSFKFAPQGPLKPQSQILEDFKATTFEEASKRDGVTFVLLWHVTPNPIEVNTWVLRNPKLTKELVGDYFPYRGITPGVIQRSKQFNQFKSEEWNFTHKIIRPDIQTTGGTGILRGRNPKKTELFIEGINDMNAGQIIAMLSPYGRVIKVEILLSPERRSKGKGFILMATEADADNVLKNKDAIGYPIFRRISRMEYLFPNMDPMLRSRLKTDITALHTITIDYVAEQIANIIKEQAGSDITIVDGTAGVGGCTFEFAKAFKKVIAFELDKGRYDMLVHNLKVVVPGKHVDTRNEDFTKSNVTADVIFVDPPWGGETRHDKEIMELYLGPYDLKGLGKILMKRTKLVVFRVPPNYDFVSFYTAFPGTIRKDLKGQSILMFKTNEQVGGSPNPAAYVLETIDGKHWRYLCPFQADINKSIPKHLLDPLIDYLEGKEFPRMELYNRTAQALIMDRMFFSTTMVPNVKFLEERAHDQDMSSIKHNLRIALTKYLDIKADDYDTLRYIEKQDIRQVIIDTLTEEFRSLIQLHEFKSVIERSSFPTSEVLLSYINEMQQFAHVLHKTLIEEYQSTKDMAQALQNTLDEKIRQEGSIIQIIGLKSRLLHIDM